MNIYLVTIICKLTHDVQIWSVLATSCEAARDMVLRVVNVGNQRGMWDVMKESNGSEAVVEATDDPTMIAAYDY